MNAGPLSRRTLAVVMLAVAPWTLSALFGLERGGPAAGLAIEVGTLLSVALALQKGASVPLPRLVGLGAWTLLLLTGGRFLVLPFALPSGSIDLDTRGRTIERLLRLAEGLGIAFHLVALLVGGLCLAGLLRRHRRTDGDV